MFSYIKILGEGDEEKYLRKEKNLNPQLQKNPSEN